MKRKPRGMAMVMVLSAIVLLMVIVAFAIEVAGRDRRNTGKLVHNLGLQQMTEATLQRARGWFGVNYGRWNEVLAYFVAHPVILQPASNIATALGQLEQDHPELVNPNTPAGYTCYIYARDNVDEFPPLPNNPSSDNDLLIYVGAVCVQTGASGSGQSSPLIAEITAPLLFSPTQAQYLSQASGGTQGLNNVSRVPGYR